MNNDELVPEVEELDATSGGAFSYGRTDGSPVSVTPVNTNTLTRKYSCHPSTANRARVGKGGVLEVSRSSTQCNDSTASAL